MLTIPTSLRVFAHRFATDMRKSFHGLVGIIESELGQQVESGHLFLFWAPRLLEYDEPISLIVFAAAHHLGTQLLGRSAEYRRVESGHIEQLERL